MNMSNLSNKPGTFDVSITLLQRREIPIRHHERRSIPPDSLYYLMGLWQMTNIFLI